VVAEIREIVKHPDADRLNVCQVDVGTGIVEYRLRSAECPRWHACTLCNGWRGLPPGLMASRS
jgi:phenylalanyl-tRNA synthetase beta chain